MTKNRILKTILTAALAVCMIVSVGNFPVSASETDTAIHVSIIHTNDIHGRVESDDYNQVLGLERVRTVVETKSSESDGMLVLDAGDYYHGQSIATIDQGESVAALLSAVGYDAMTAGNHDWNYGQDRLKELADISDVPILTGNVVDEDGNAFFDQEYLIKEIEKDGVTLKIGVFGVIDPEIYSATAPDNVDGLTFTDMAEYAAKAQEELRAQGCQVVIGLAHCIAPASLAASVDGVDLWIAGHEHTEIDTEVTTPNGGTSLVVETGYYLWTIGDVELDCTLDADGNLLSLSLDEQLISYEEGTEIEKNAEIVSLLEEIAEAQSPILDEVIASVSEDLDGVWEHTRIGETNLGRAIACGYLLETGADVAFENAGGIRDSIAAGDVTYGDVLNVSPYGNYVVTKSLTGAEIVSMMETSLDIMKSNIASNEAGDYDGWVSNSGNVLQIAGMQVTYDMSQEKGNRVVSCTIQGEPVEADREYLVAMNNYLATDTADYPELDGKSNVNEYGACEDILTAYLNQDESLILEQIHTLGLIEATEENDDSPSATDDGADDTSDTDGTDDGTGTDDLSDTDDSDDADDADGTDDTNASDDTDDAVAADGADDSDSDSDSNSTDSSSASVTTASTAQTGDDDFGYLFVLMAVAVLVGTTVYNKKRGESA
ncbi:MAG: bifunctional metallophosphatase/5'-nucleotidase [Clostridiales bacterium]|nr:bifunctional metallophosphatase/5'-nucleotidase [Clostridiales bacterium]